MRKEKPIEWVKIKELFISGVSPQEICKIYSSLTPAQVSSKAQKQKWVEIRDKISEKIPQKVENKVEALTNKALRRLDDVLSDEDTEKSVLISACKAVLDISGLKSFNQTIKTENITPIKIEFVE